MSIDYLSLVQIQHRKHAYFRDFVIKMITRLSIARLIKPKTRITSQHVGDVVITSRLEKYNDIVLMAHFDSSGQISEADRHLLRKFKEIGYEVVLISTSVQGEAKHKELWTEIGDEVDGLLTKPNSGFDFGSWACGISQLEISKKLTGNLILINNSVFGPFGKLESLLNSWNTDCPIFGITSSNEFVEHVQSYFIGFRNSMLRELAFINYWKSDFDQKIKWNTILRNEMRWANYFKSAGFSVCVKHEPPKGFLRNPLTFHWSNLLRNGMPFVKKSLFTHNYDHIDLDNWKAEFYPNDQDFPLVFIEQLVNDFRSMDSK